MLMVTALYNEIDVIEIISTHKYKIRIKLNALGYKTCYQHVRISKT